MTKPVAADVCPTISDEVREYVYGQLAQAALINVNEGRDPGSFVVFAIHVDPGSRWHCIVKRVFSPKQVAEAMKDGPPVFIYGDLDIDIFLEVFGEADEELENNVQAKRDEGDVRAVIIGHDGFFFADIQPVLMFN